MTDFTDGTTSGVVTKKITPNLELTVIQVRVPATFVWGTDSLIVDLADYGAHNIAGFLAFEETTAGSVTIAATGTSSVSTTTLTIDSTGSSANTCGGTFVIFAF